MKEGPPGGIQARVEGTVRAAQEALVLMEHSLELADAAGALAHRIEGALEETDGEADQEGSGDAQRGS